MQKTDWTGRSLILLAIIIVVMSGVLFGVMRIFDNKSLTKTEEEAFKLNVYEYCLRIEEYKNIYGNESAENLNICGVELKSVIPEIIETDMSKFKISQGKLTYIGIDEQEKKWTEEVKL